MTPARSRTRSLANGLLIGVFVVGLFLPLAAQFVGLELADPPCEKRRLAELPKLGLHRKFLEPFPGRFEAYYGDHFGLRNTFIRWLDVAKVCWLGVSTSPKVILGKDGWLFYTETPVTDFASKQPFSPAQLVQWQIALEANRAWLAQRHIRYVVMFVPDKQTIYGEYLPAGLAKKPVGGKSRLDQLLEHLQAHSEVEVVDLRGPLRRAKAEGPIYQLTDSHWNARGAFVAYQELTRFLGGWFPAVAPWLPSCFGIEEQTAIGGDLAKMLNLQDRLPEPGVTLVSLRPQAARTVKTPWRTWYDTPALATECPDGRLPRAVMFNDSFLCHLHPFLSEHFRRIVYLAQEGIDEAIVEREQPDVVIHEVVERKLLYNNPLDFRAQKNNPFAFRVLNR